MTDLDGRILAWNPAAERLYGWTEAQALQMTLRERIPPAEVNMAMDRLKQLSQGQVLALYPTQRLTNTGKVVDVSLLATALIDATGKVYAVTTTERLRQSDT